MTDGAGSAIAINSYDEHGIPGSSNIGRFQYTGQAWLPELGMYYYRARIYSPTLGRFLQTDPIGLGGGMNLYAYAGNDPVNRTDPSGLDPELVVTALCSSRAFIQNGSCYAKRDPMVINPRQDGCQSGFADLLDECRRRAGIDDRLHAVNRRGVDPAVSAAQQRACQSIPELRNPTVQATIRDVRMHMLMHIDWTRQRNQVEYGAWIEPRGSGWRAGPTFTDGERYTLDANSRMSWRTWWNGGAIVVHSHTGHLITQLSEQDVRNANRYNILVIVVDAAGRTYCHDSR